ncbi:MAG: dihydroneopterin triphosphate 2'-epimerase, partial [Gammaproteobacteria bacterium]
MESANAIIKITNLRLRTYIGFNQEEKVNKQDVVINIAIYYPAEKASTTDDVSDALNYKTVCKKVIQHVEEGRFLLLERLVSDILAIAIDHPWVEKAVVTV